MDQLSQVLQTMISITADESAELLSKCMLKKFNRYEILSRPNYIPNEIFFIKKGLVRVVITDNQGIEHTIHFALENQFIADYSGFMRKQKSPYLLEATEETEVVIMPRSAVEWGYQHLKEGNKLGRLIAEFYFIYHDNRIKNQYIKTPKERYDTITEVFPGIHNRVPQHMIASYLGITSVHLSRIKKEALRKV